MKESSPNLEDWDIEERAQKAITAVDTSSNGCITFADFITVMDKARNQRQSSPFSELADKIEARTTKVAGQTLFYAFLALTFWRSWRPPPSSSTTSRYENPWAYMCTRIS
jgi:hypothetical protein